MLPTTIPGAWTPSTPIPYTPYFGFGSSNQVYSNSLPVDNTQNDGDGENQPSRPYIPDASDSVQFTPYGSTPSNTGGSASNNVITLQPADSTHPGGITTGAQSLAGNKTFVGDVVAANLSTGGSVNAASGVITGNLQAGSIDMVNYIDIPTTTGLTVGTIQQNNSRLLHTYGTNNLALGSDSMNYTTTGNANLSVGAQNMASLTSGNSNTGIGYGALRSVTSGSANTCIGGSAGFFLTTGNNNVLEGLNSGAGLTSGSSNVCIGPNTGSSLTTQSNVTEVGNGTLKVPAAGDVILGQSSSTACFIGGIAGVTPPGTPQRVVIDPVTKQLGSTVMPLAGVSSLSAIGSAPNANGATITGVTLNLEPASATFGGVLTTGAQSIAGVKTLTSNLIGTSIDPVDYVNVPNTVSSAVGTYRIGNFASLHNFGTNNIWVGSSAGNFSTTGNACVGVGVRALNGITSGTVNVAIGSDAGRVVSNGSLNVIVGGAAGFSQTTSTGNTLLGANAGVNISTGSNIIAIGANSGSNPTTASNIIEISNGTFGSSVAGDVRIGYSSSTQCYLGGIGTTAVGGTPRLVTINTATNQLGSIVLPATITYSTASAAYTPTVDVGTITSLTSNGGATTTLALQYTLQGTIATLMIPQFTLVTLSGSPSTINVNTASIPAAYRPVITHAWCIPFNRSTPTCAFIYLTAGGNVTIQRDTGGQFANGNGTFNNFTMTYSVI